MKKTKIVCTIGPASEQKEIFTKLVLEGLNVARLNFSHGDHEEHGKRTKMIKEVRKELDNPVAILLDTKGPEIRTGKFKDPEVYLEEGNKFTITSRDVMGDETICSVTYSDIAEDLQVNDLILIDDGLVGLKVDKIVDGTDLICTVQNSGIVKNHKGVNLPGVKINLPALTEKDISDIIFGIENDIDYIAASFVRKAVDVLAIREILEKHNASHIQIISKIENQEGMDNLDAIIEVSDGIMVARGDLGVEIPTEEIPLAQKEMIRKCNLVGKPVITATQMLDSMMRNPRPTRAEVTDVANAIFDGTDAIMLSGETAAGKYPIESVRTMSNIAKRTEEALDYNGLINIIMQGERCTITDAISHATCNTARDLDASAIITATSSGNTAKNISKFRPETPIIATTTTERVRRKLSLIWGVYSIITEEHKSTDHIIESSAQKAIESNLIKNGDLVVITAGVPVGQAGTTNLIKVHIVRELIRSGTGIGNKAAAGKVVVVKNMKDSTKEFNKGDILVAAATAKDLIPLMEIAGAIIAEEGGLTSHAAIVGLNFALPTVVGVEDATTILADGDVVTVDAMTGSIFRGRTRV
ncbi:MAG: pyruvate kinase [Alkaliphilus sp.]